MRVPTRYKRTSGATAFAARSFTRIACRHTDVALTPPVVSPAGRHIGHPRLFTHVNFIGSCRVIVRPVKASTDSPFTSGRIQNVRFGNKVRS